MSPSVALASRQLYLCQDIQGDPGRKVGILGGDSIGHCEENVYMNVRPILNVYQEIKIRGKVIALQAWTGSEG
jgi:hypothetical protein